MGGKTRDNIKGLPIHIGGLVGFKEYREKDSKAARSAWDEARGTCRTCKFKSKLYERY